MDTKPIVRNKYNTDQITQCTPKQAHCTTSGHSRLRNFRFVRRPILIGWWPDALESSKPYSCSLFFSYVNSSKNPYNSYHGSRRDEGAWFFDQNTEWCQSVPRHSPFLQILPSSEQFFFLIPARIQCVRIIIMTSFCMPGYKFFLLYCFAFIHTSLLLTLCGQKFVIDVS